MLFRFTRSGRTNYCVACGTWLVALERDAWRIHPGHLHLQATILEAIGVPMINVITCYHLQRLMMNPVFALRCILCSLCPLPRLVKKAIIVSPSAKYAACELQRPPSMAWVWYQVSFAYGFLLAADRLAYFGRCHVHIFLASAPRQDPHLITCRICANATIGSAFTVTPKLCVF